ncbi:hypothetical protein BDN67DRAFT_955674 [Paxillus ammoniavirescens]|nr:hypothetical protein BDN67DRAFT_955674 [Paxillus ammoniavirescens]
MVNLAELRLHLRDEYMCKTEARECLKRKRRLASTTMSSSTAAPQSTSDSASDLGEEDSLSVITQTLRERSDLDDVGGDHDFTPTLEKIKLTQLFNFSDTTWTEIIQKMSMKSLDEELEFYELVEMDAEGEVDDVDIANDPMFSR